ncbi:MAG: CRISPR-associated protein Cas7 [Lewinellaceae bacterium]|nr:CRISPR-associated protein Cas7 [Lewinellaceae bacterium]
MPRYLYLRGLRQVDHTVFGVDNGQKAYYSPINNRPQPYSSGQQVKRSIMDMLVDLLEESRAPITFNYQVSQNKKGEPTIEQKEPWNPCDPLFADQLIGGWMRAEKNVGTLKRRSPLSVSAMRPLHPSLANLESSEHGTFDRSDNPQQHVVKVRDEKGNELTTNQIKELLTSIDRSLPLRNWLDLGTRANGLFVFDVAIDLDRLFTVSTNTYDPEIRPDKIDELIAQGWRNDEEKGVLIVPLSRQQAIIEAIADSLIDWRISSNQSRTFSPQGTLAVALSMNANSIVNAIRADLRDDQANDRFLADPVLDETIPGVNLFVTPAAKGFIKDVTVDNNALQNAKVKIREYLLDSIIS